MFVIAPYKSLDEVIVVNAANVVIAQPRIGKVGMPGERKGATYTSFLMTSHIGMSPTVDTLLEWDKWIELITPFESEWVKT